MKINILEFYNWMHIINGFFPKISQKIAWTLIEMENEILNITSTQKISMLILTGSTSIIVLQ